MTLTADQRSHLEKLHRDPERFGICEDTGREIPFERLDVVPWARTCQNQG
jgi:RNA polymerase-binding transcription factor DksA